MTLIEQQIVFEEEEKRKKELKKNQGVLEALGISYQQKLGISPPRKESPSQGLLDQKGKTPNENYGEHVRMNYDPNRSTMGSVWNDFGGIIRQKFLDQGEDVPRKKLFPSDVNLYSTENMTFNQPLDTVSESDGLTQGDYQEQQALQKMGETEWRLRDDGRLGAAGLANPSNELYFGFTNPSGYNESHLGISKQGADMSTPKTIEEYDRSGNLINSVNMRTDNVTGHEYAHYIGNYFSNGNHSLSDITEDLMLNDTNGVPTQAELMEAWMNDPRTEHLDVFDKLNTKPVSAKVNPRAILGKFYTTSLIEEGGNFENMRENIARSLQGFFGDEYFNQGHGILVTDQKKDVMSALAKLLNNIPR